MRFVPLAIQMLILAIPLAAADPFSSLLPAESLHTLRGGGSASSNIPVDGSLSLLPSVASRAKIAQEVKTFRPTLGVELLQILGGLAQPADTPAGWLATYNALQSASSLRGITYWSKTRNKAQVLFLQSYVISSVSHPARIADPVFNTIPAEDDLFTFQEDNSFGRNTFQTHLSFHGDHLVVKMENLSTIFMMLLPVVKPRNFVSQVVLVPAGKDILFYGTSYLRTAMPIGDWRSRDESLKNRLIAMAEWLKTRLSAAHTP
ncbi:MAG: DUF6675 family protein [Spirochaetia bacterium]